MKGRTVQSYNETLASGSFWAAMMVVGLHSYNVGNTVFGIEKGIVAALSHGLFTAAVPFFFIVAGYLFYKNVSTYSDMGRKLKSRIRLLLMPYLAWGATYYAVWIVLYHFGLTSVDVNISLLGILKAAAFHQFYYPMWFMFALMAFTVLTAIWLPFIRKCKWVVFTVLLVCVYLALNNGCLSFMVDGKEFVYFRGNFYCYYLLGCIGGLYPELLEKPRQLILKTPIWAWGVLFILAGILEGLVYDEFILLSNNRIFIPVVAFGYIGLITSLGQRQISIWSPRNVSPMIVYGIHGLTGLVVGLVLSRSGLSVLPCFFLAFISNAILACLAARVIKILPPLYFIFSGGR